MGTRHNPDLIVTSKFYVVGAKKDIPRVEVTVEGYTFVYGRSSDFQVVLMMEPNIGKGLFRQRVKQEAYTIAGAVFNQHLGRPQELRVQQKLF